MDLQIVHQLAQALEHPLPGVAAQQRMAGRVVTMPDAVPAHARPSAVLGLLYPHEGELTLLLIRRTEDGHVHSGQISFPGGKKESSDADLRATALREAQEEVGVMSTDVQLLGALTQLYIPVSNFQVFPFVGYAAKRPPYHINRHEVDEIIEAPLSRLFRPEHKVVTRIRPRSRPGLILKAPAYIPAENQVIWGATAMILSELEAVWEGIRG